jgi:hypothetical protein
MSARVDLSSRNFFRAMVLMGSGLAVGCGGKTVEGESSDPSAGGSAGTGGSVVHTGGQGGHAPTGSGGSPLIVVPPPGPDPNTPVEPGPFTCNPAQWDCSRTTTSCGGGTGWTLPTSCACDTARPRSADDCATGQKLVCRLGVNAPDGRPLTRPVPFECFCSNEQSCNPACFPLDVGGDFACPDSEDPRSILCGCAYVLLR